MAQLSEYIRSIAVLLVFSAFIGIITPNGRYRGYIDVVLGFLIIFTVLGPVVRFFGGHGEAAPAFAQATGTFSSKSAALREEDALQAELVAENYRYILQKQLTALLEPEGYVPVELQVAFDTGTGVIESLAIEVSATEKQRKAPVITIEKPVVPAIGEAGKYETEDPKAKAAARLKGVISNYYGVAEEHIVITMG